MGYKEVEPADPYNKMEPKQYKALLDKYGLKMYSTHSGATDGPAWRSSSRVRRSWGSSTPASERQAGRRSARRRAASRPAARLPAPGAAAARSRRVLREVSNR